MYKECSTVLTTLNTGRLNFAPASQLLSSVLRSGEPTEVVSLAVSAAQCMREVAIGDETWTRPHPGEGEEKVTCEVGVVWTMQLLNLLFILFLLFLSLRTGLS